MAVKIHNVAAFNRALKKRMKTIPQDLLDPFMRKLGLVAMGKIAARTPVKTGHLANRWQITFGKLPGRTSADDPPQKGAKVPIRAIQRARKALKVIPPMTIIFISNNVIYAEPVEKGHRGRAGRHMVSGVAAELRAKLEAGL
jgi:hypothetical protein